jgi:hypothetical protein
MALLGDEKRTHGETAVDPTRRGDGAPLQGERKSAERNGAAVLPGSRGKTTARRARQNRCSVSGSCAAGPEPEAVAASEVTCAAWAGSAQVGLCATEVYVTPSTVQAISVPSACQVPIAAAGVAETVPSVWKSMVASPLPATA